MKHIAATEPYSVYLMCEFTDESYLTKDGGLIVILTPTGRA
jgi:hypothetical protein